MKANRNRDTYEVWEETGQLEDVLKFISKGTRILMTQKEMCLRLEISEKTFERMRKKHKRFNDAFVHAKLQVKEDLVSALLKRALGSEALDESQLIEDGGKGKPPKRKITKTKKTVLPDRGSIIYLLSKHFGREYLERSYELELLEQKFLEGKEEWDNANDDKDN